jgi:hypothetical protein
MHTAILADPYARDSISQRASRPTPFMVEAAPVISLLAAVGALFALGMTGVPV